jgi:cytochrome c
MVKYILSFTDAQPKALPLKGKLTAGQHVDDNSRGFYVMRANYTDKGNPVTGTLTGTKLITLRHPMVQAEDFDLSANVSTRHVDGTDITFLANIQPGSYVGFKDIDLTGIDKVHFKASSRQKGSVIEMRAGTPGGTLLATAEVPQVQKLSDPVKLTSLSVNSSSQQDLFFVFRNTEGQKENLLFLDWMYFDNGKMPVPKP